MQRHTILRPVHRSCLCLVRPVRRHGARSLRVGVRDSLLFFLSFYCFSSLFFFLPISFSTTESIVRRMTDSEIEMHYTPPTSDTIQTKPFPIRGNILNASRTTELQRTVSSSPSFPLYLYLYLSIYISVSCIS